MVAPASARALITPPVAAVYAAEVEKVLCESVGGLRPPLQGRPLPGGRR